MSTTGDARELTCADVEALGPELAIGTLDGSERASALVHLETCPGCRRFVDELAAVADNILLLAPEAEPPIGFESRTAARIAAVADDVPDTRPAPVPLPVPLAPRPRARRRLVAVAAAAFIVGALGAGTAAWWATGRAHGNDTASPVVRTAVVRVDNNNGRYSCHAIVVGTKPVWLYLSVNEPGGNGHYRIEAAGPKITVPIGTVDVRGGKGAVGVVLRDVAPSDLSELRVFDESGTLRYRAKFTTNVA
jgi:hypothetical protein